VEGSGKGEGRHKRISKEDAQAFKLASVAVRLSPRPLALLAARAIAGDGGGGRIGSR